MLAAATYQVFRNGLDLWLLTSPNQAQKEIEKGQAPRGIERVDRRNPNLPGSQDEVHVNGGAIKRDGTIKHSLRAPLTNAQKAWLRNWGFKIPAGS